MKDFLIKIVGSFFVTLSLWVPAGAQNEQHIHKDVAPGKSYEAYYTTLTKGQIHSLSVTPVAPYEIKEAKLGNQDPETDNAFWAGHESRPNSFYVAGMDSSRHYRANVDITFKQRQGGGKGLDPALVTMGNYWILAETAKAAPSDPNRAREHIGVGESCAVRAQSKLDGIGVAIWHYDMDKVKIISAGNNTIMFKPLGNFEGETTQITFAYESLSAKTKGKLAHKVFTVYKPTHLSARLRNVTGQVGLTTNQYPGILGVSGSLFVRIHPDNVSFSHLEYLEEDESENQMICVPSSGSNMNECIIIGKSPPVHGPNKQWVKFNDNNEVPDYVSWGGSVFGEGQHGRNIRPSGQTYTPSTITYKCSFKWRLPEIPSHIAGTKVPPETNQIHGVQLDGTCYIKKFDVTIMRNPVTNESTGSP